MHVGDFRTLPFGLRLLHWRLRLRRCYAACRLKVLLFENLDDLFMVRDGNALPDLLELFVQWRTQRRVVDPHHFCEIVFLAA